MCVSEIPGLLYYAYLPSIILSVLFGVFIYLQNRKNILNKLLLLISFIFSLYTTVDFLTWFPWSIGNYLLFQRFLMLIMIILPSFVYFSYHISGVAISKIKHFFILIPISLILIINFSKFNDLLYYVDRSEGGINCFVKLGPLYLAVFIIAAYYLLWSVIILLRNYYKFKENDIVRKRIGIVIISVAFLIVWVAALIKIVDYFGENTLLFIPLGMVIFVVLLSYAITKYKLFNIKLLAAQALIVAMIILVGSEFFFADSWSNRILIGITLFLTIIFGIMLVHSVKLEVQRKEELQTMSDKLTEANDQLRKLDNAKSEFISIASHQLRTPLTAIKGFVSLLLEGTYGMVDPKVRDALNKVYLSNERMVELVENLLNISRIESGRMEYQYQKWKVEGIIRELYDSFLLISKNKGLALEINLPEVALPEVEIDGPKAREVISNLMDNALKYTKEGGVSVKAELSKYKDGIDYVRIAVTDTGIGVPKEELPYLFSKFSRGHDVGRLHAGGTGLGLYVGKSMIEAQHGKLWVESEGEGKGSTFIIELPVSQEKFQRHDKMGDFIKEI